MTSSAPYSATPCRVERRVRDELDVLQLVDLDLALVDDASPLAEPGQLRDPAHDPAHVVLRLDEVHAAHAALAEHDRALHARPGRRRRRARRCRRSSPARSAPGASRGGTPRRRSRSGCRSSGGPPISQREMQTLQPMHSRMSSSRPSSIFCGRNGSAIEGRAVRDDVERAVVDRLDHASGFVQRPTPSTGFFVDLLDPLLPRSCAPCS